MQRFIRIQIASGRGNNPEYGTDSDDGKSEGIEAIEKPVLKQGGAGQRNRIFDIRRRDIAMRLIFQLDHATIIHLRAGTFSAGMSLAEGISKFGGMERWQGAATITNWWAKKVFQQPGG